ncbi:hypothetical protein F4824DRAFT_155385 [Ustulina deusta]|nr:hypothetical protein F4824DRAFT_155385 [Ustulina deusta]
MPPSAANGMPYSFERLMEMGDALTKARRERTFPTTITPTYNLQAVIDDYNDLQRLNAAREAESRIRDHAFRQDICRLYIEIQQKIQDRDLPHSEVSANTNAHARLSGLSSGTSAEIGMYNHTRHSVQSAFNHPSLEGDSNIIDHVASRVTNEIRRTIEGQVIHGAYGVNEVNMSAVIDHVFGAIEDALSHGVGAQANTVRGAAVHSQEELDRIVTNLIEASPQSNAPAPATEAAIASLQKKKLDERMLGSELKGQCTICIDEVKVGDEVVVLPCKHWFHQECATLWLKQHNSCPVCRAAINGEAVGSLRNEATNSPHATRSTDPSSPSRPTPTER